MTALMAPAAQQVLEAIAALELGGPSATGARDGDVMTTLDDFYQKGLLQK